MSRNEIGAYYTVVPIKFLPFGLKMGTLKITWVVTIAVQFVYFRLVSHIRLNKIFDSRCVKHGTDRTFEILEIR